MHYLFHVAQTNRSPLLVGSFIRTQAYMFCLIRIGHIFEVYYFVTVRWYNFFKFRFVSFQLLSSYNLIDWTELSLLALRCAFGISALTEIRIPRAPLQFTNLYILSSYTKVKFSIIWVSMKWEKICYLNMPYYFPIHIKKPLRTKNASKTKLKVMFCNKLIVSANK